MTKQNCLTTTWSSPWTAAKTGIEAVLLVLVVAVVVDLLHPLREPLEDLATTKRTTNAPTLTAGRRDRARTASTWLIQPQSKKKRTTDRHYA